jgi:hypothetical protein
MANRAEPESWPGPKKAPVGTFSRIKPMVEGHPNFLHFPLA